MSVNASVPRNPLENVVSGKDEVWQRPCPGTHEPLDPNKDIRSCSVWKTITFKPKDGYTGCWSWKVGQTVVVAVYKVKNNMPSNKEDSIVHGSALHRSRGTLSCSELKQAAQLASSSCVLEVCQPPQCISPPTVMDCVHMHEKLLRHVTKQSCLRENSLKVCVLTLHRSWIIPI